MELWAHQIAAKRTARDAISSGCRGGLWSMPTGSGKTVTFASLAADLEWPTLVLVHRDELVSQTVQAFGRVWPEASVGVVKSSRDEWADGQKVVVASVPTLHAKRLARIPRDRFALVIADESHHAAADSWQRVLDHFDARFVLGCSATPGRHDRKRVELFDDRPLYTYSVFDAIADKVLVPLRQFAIATGLDLNGVSTRAGDFAENELSVVVNCPARNRRIVEAFQEYAPGRRAIAFCVSVQHVHDLADTFIDAGICADVVTGSTPIDERRDRIRRFAAGEIQVLANCQVLVEGFDDPAVDCILMCRPTQSAPLYQQALGRGLRQSSSTGKTDLIVLDITDGCDRHRLVNACSLLGAPEDMNDAGGEFVAEAVQQRMRRPRTMPCRLQDCEIHPWTEAPSLIGYVEEFAWQRGPASDKQTTYIRTGFSLDLERPLTKGEAGYIIDHALKLDAQYPVPATPKQRGFLKWRGAWRSGLSKRDATRLIGELKSSGACVA